MTLRTLGRAAAAAVALALSACGQSAPAEGEQAEAAAADYPRGPHNGRLLSDGAFAVEITIFEDGVEPEFRVYPYRDDKPVDPRQVRLTVELTRLGGKVDRFAFAPREDFLIGNGVVTEPHSFDVRVAAVEGGRTHNWAYASHEGRTTIAPEAARAGGVTTETAGPAEFAEVIDVSGQLHLRPEGRSEIRAWFPGRVVAMTKELGDTVQRGEIIARVESSYSLQTYSIPAPMSGTVIERNANPGGVAGDDPIYVIGDTRQLHAEFFLYPRDAEQVQVGQSAEVRSLTGQQRSQSQVETILPTAEAGTQTVVAHVPVPYQGGAWRPGIAVEGSIKVGAQTAPLAVRTRALQRFRDFTVVFAKVGDTYEVRMLELGRQTPEWTEVTGGLDPGTEYVVDGAFLIRADVEKSGASHDH
jgi:cobalt-zinc-cadmium efflux system membrane fusion protein